MKRVTSLIVAILSVLYVTFALADTTTTYICDTPGGVYVRDPDSHEHLLDGGEFMVVPYGQTVQVVSQDDYWLKIKLPDGSYGIIFSQYAHEATPGESAPYQGRQASRTPIVINNDYALFKGVCLENCKVYRQENKEVIGRLEKGDEVYVRKTGLYWYKIVYQGKEIAYVQSDKVQLIDANIPFEGTVYCTSGENSANKFAVREQPSYDAKTIATLEFGTYVRVLQEVDSQWVKIAYAATGNIGYMRKVWLKPTYLFRAK